MITLGSPVITVQSLENELIDLSSTNNSSTKSSPPLSRIVAEILPNKCDSNSAAAEQSSLEEKVATQIDSTAAAIEAFTSDYKVVFLNNDVLRKVFALVSPESPEFTTRSRRVCRQFFHALDPSHQNMIIYWRHHFNLKYANGCNLAELTPPQNWYENYKRHAMLAKHRANIGTAALVGGAVFLGGLLLGAFMRSGEPRGRERRGSEEDTGFGTSLALSAAAAGVAGVATYCAISAPPDRERKKGDNQNSLQKRQEIYWEEEEQPVQHRVQVIDEQLEVEANRPIPYPLQPELRQRRMPNYSQSQRELQMQLEVDRKMAEIAQEELEQQEKCPGCPDDCTIL